MKYLATAAVLLGVVSLSLLVAPGEDRIYTVDEAANMSDQLQEQNISIQGEAVQGRVACTQMACIGEDRCCNTCSGPIELEGNNSNIVLQGEEIGCSGTNCEVNCTPETGEEHVFKGSLHEDYGQLRFEVRNYSEVEQ